jgi:hypothetical protein
MKMIRRTATSLAGLAFAVICSGCPNEQAPGSRSSQTAKTAKSKAKAKAKTTSGVLLMLRIEQPQQKWRTYVKISRVGDLYTIYQVNTFTRGDKEAPAYAAARRRVSKRLVLPGGDRVMRTAAFSERAFRHPNHVRFIGSMDMADSVTRIFGTKKQTILASELATKGKVHFFAYLEGSKRGALYSFTIDAKTDQVSEVEVNGVETFRRVNAFHAKRLTGKLAGAKNLYLELLEKL